VPSTWQRCRSSLLNKLETLAFNNTTAILQPALSLLGPTNFQKRRKPFFSSGLGSKLCFIDYRHDSKVGGQDIDRVESRSLSSL
jgi:hypothetical protein